MTTSGVATLNFDVNEILQEAWERATGGMDMRAGYQLRTARRSLNLLLLEWANKGINLFTIEEIVVPLVAGQDEYTLPADTVDLIEHVYRTGTGQSQTDRTLTRITVSTYATLVNKQTQGVPNQIYIDRQIQPVIHIYPVPLTNATLVCWRLRRIQDALTGSNTMDMPFRFIPALIAGTAFHIAMKVPEGAGRVELLKSAYNEAWMDAADEDRDRSSWYVTPGIGRG